MPCIWFALFLLFTLPVLGATISPWLFVLNQCSIIWSSSGQQLSGGVIFDYLQRWVFRDNLFVLFQSGAKSQILSFDYNLRWRTSTRFSECFILIHDFSHWRHTQQELTIAYGASYLSIFSVNLNIFIAPNDPASKYLMLVRAMEKIVTLPFAGPSLLLFPDFSNLAVMSATSKSSSYFPLPTSINVVSGDSKPLELILKLWRSTHRNLHKFTLAASGYKHYSSACGFGGYLDDKTETDPISCIMHLIAFYYNATLKPSRLGPLVISTNIIISDEVLNPIFRNDYFAVSESWHTIFSAPTLQPWPFGFIIISDPVENDLSAMTQPFHGKVWLVLVLFIIIIMPLAMVILTMETGCLPPMKNSLIKSYRQWIFSSATSLLDQNWEQSSRKLRHNPTAHILWTLWSFAALILMNAYDGELYSFLASKAAPSTPNNLEELSVSTYPKITFTAGGRVFPNGSLEKLSIFKYRLQASFDSSHGALQKVYRKLYDDIKFYSKPTMQPQFETHEILENMFSPSNTNESYYYPATFAMIDQTTTSLDIIQPLIEVAVGKTVLKRILIDHFSSHLAWVIKNFFLLSQIESIVWTVNENGLRNWWNNRVVRYRMLEAAKTLQKNLYEKGDTSTIPATYNIASFLLNSDEKNRKRDAKEDREPKPIPLSLIKTVVLLCAILYLGGIVSFVGEGIYRPIFKQKLFSLAKHSRYK
ncbi:unnamed protein product [Orchesella dallaii]|uniref:Uncharacterized protein n=1 Tax=Orchesella dallaii TaxID=48710 RepID=A0ABP1Q374_9HEXA